MGGPHLPTRVILSFLSSLLRIRYNVRDYHQGSESVTPIPMEQRFQFGAPPPPPPATNVSNNNTNVHFAPHPSVTHIGTPGYGIPPEQQEAQINAVVRRPSSNRASTLGLSFHNRLEKIRFVFCCYQFGFTRPLDYNWLKHPVLRNSFPFCLQECPDECRTAEKPTRNAIMRHLTLCTHLRYAFLRFMLF